MPRSLLLALSFACCAAFAADKGDVAPDPLAQVILERIAASDVPVCIAAADVAESTRFSFGCSKDAGPAALDRDSVFEIGSVTKAFTGILLADMVLKREVSLDDPASKYSRPGAKLPTRGGREITLRDLATQTSGLPRLPPGMSPANPADPYADFSSDKLYEALARTELQADIGTRYLYSNFGYMWLSDIVSRVGGGTYEQVLRKRVLEPLGMKDTAILLDDRGRRPIPGHDRMRKVVPPWNNAPELAGVGGLRSTIGDMAKFAEAVAGRRDSPLKDAIDLALRVQRPAQGSISIGLGWHLLARPDGTTIATHNGATAGFRAMVAVDRAKGRAAVVLGDAPEILDDLAVHLVDGAYPLRVKRIAVTLEPDAAQEYVGRYQVSPKFSIALFMKDGKLMTQGTGQAAVEVFAESKDHLFLRAVDAQLVFDRDGQGRIAGMTIHQNGRELRAPRVSDQP